MMKHLQDRRDDWADATDQEVTEALLDMPTLICPFFMAYVQSSRPQSLRRSLLLHEDMGGYIGAPARRWLKGRQ